MQIPTNNLDYTTLPRFCATTSATPSSSGFAAITSYTESYDVGGDFSGGIFTVPVDGCYSFNVNMGVSNLIGRFEIRLVVNDESNVVGHAFVYGNSAVYDPATTIATDIELESDDEVQVYAYSEGGATALDSFSSFSGHLVALS